MERSEFKEVLEEVLHEHYGIDKDTHTSHHQYVQMQIQRDERRQELRRQFEKSAIGVIVLAGFGFLGWLGSLILRWFQNGGHH